MVDYLYKTRIWFDTTDVVGDIDPATEAANTADFEANYKSQCYPVDDIELLETFFMVEWDYATMKAKIGEEVVAWTDVKLETGDKFYDLYILTPNQL